MKSRFLKFIFYILQCFNFFKIGFTWRSCLYLALKPQLSLTLTESGAGIRPGNRRHDDETETLVLSSLDLHVVRLKGSRYHRAPAAPSTSAAYAAGGATARADRVEWVLAPLRGSLSLRQTRCLGAAVMGGGWGWGNVTISFWTWWEKRVRSHRLDKLTEERVMEGPFI